VIPSSPVPAPIARLEALMSTTRSISLTLLAAVTLAACGASKEHERQDSVLVAATMQKARLAAQLGAQKDSLTRIVLQADDFIMRIDSSVSRVVGSKRGKGTRGQLDPLAQQIDNRRAVMARVDSLVKRAQRTASQLAAANRNNAALRAQLASDSAMIADLNTTIQRQTATIEGLSTRVDSLNGVARELGTTIATLETRHHKAFYVIGREDDLVQKGVVVREGGANLLFAHPGRTLQIARTVSPEVFTAVDQRGTQVIQVPDSTQRYRIVSRQSLDYAAVDGRDRDTFVGNLRIAEPVKFWGPSRFLVIVAQ
jgi:hypothetical protein